MCEDEGRGPTTMRRFVRDAPESSAQLRCERLDWSSVDVEWKRREAALGTTGRGRFEDYEPGGDSSGSPGGRERGEEQPSDRCLEELLIGLEEVARCPYYNTHSAVPSAGERVTLQPPLEHGRPTVRTAAGEALGFLPTRLNYVASECFHRGVTYEGEVTDSAMAPVPSVGVRLRPNV